MRPQGNPVEKEIKKRGRDLVFVLDISRNMLAKDLQPNRLERAKELIASVVQELSGDRVGLLLFSGSTVMKSPLTHDYSFFLHILSKVKTSNINLGGTNIGDAIRLQN